MPAPTVVSSSTGSTTANGDFSVTAPASISNGNLLVAFQAVDGILTTSPAAPTGWSTLGSTTWDGSTGLLACYYKVASSEPGSYTFHTGDGTISGVFIVNLSGAATAPDRHGENTGSSTTSAACVSWQAADANKRALCCAACNASTTISSWDNAPADLGTINIGSLPAMSMDVVHLTWASQPPAESATLGTSSNWATQLVTVPGSAPPAALAGRPNVIRPPLHPSYLE
jgi:hypothetical protein